MIIAKIVGTVLIAKVASEELDRREPEVFSWNLKKIKKYICVFDFAGQATSLLLECLLLHLCKNALLGFLVALFSTLSILFFSRQQLATVDHLRTFVNFDEEESHYEAETKRK